MIYDATPTMGIGEASKASGLSEDTLRYYERIGLAGPIERAGGQRRYSERDLYWLKFITHMRAAEMPIETLQRYAALTRAGEHTKAAREALLLEHARSVEMRIAELEAALAAIHAKLERLRDGISLSDRPPHC